VLHSNNMPGDEELFRADGCAARVRGADYAGRYRDTLTDLAFAYYGIRNVTRASRVSGALSEADARWEADAYQLFIEAYETQYRLNY
jgi:hypothetical protein